MLRVPAPLLRRAVRVVSARIFDPRQSFVEQRRRVDRSTRLPFAPRGTRSRVEIIGGVRCTVITSARSAGGPTILHLHGGGFVVGSPRTYRPFAGRLAAVTGATVVVPDYRLAPEHPWPAAVEDSLAVWRALVSGPAGDVVVSGDSAGGNLALQVCLAARDAGGVAPSCGVLISPAVDLTRDHFGDPRPGTRELMLREEWSNAAIDAYAGEHDRAHPGLSPIAARLEGLPPLLIVAAVEEVLAVDADRLSELARAAGVDVIDVRGRGMWHVYPLQAGVSAEADDALARIAAFVSVHTGSGMSLGPRSPAAT